MLILIRFSLSTRAGHRGEGGGLAEGVESKITLEDYEEGLFNDEKVL